MAKERLMTAGEVASYLRCSISTVRRLAQRSGLPHYRLGKIVRFRREEIDTWLAGRHQGDVPASVRPPVRDPDQLSLFES